MPHVTLETEGAIARIMLDLPGAVTPAVCREVEVACDRIRRDSSARCVALLGGPLSAGWDLDAFAPDGPGDAFIPLADLDLPVVAALDGDVSSAGLALALCADIRIASDRATFAVPEVSDGHMPLAGSIGRLVRAVGRGAALSLILTAEPVDAATALRIGLVSEVVSEDRLDDRAMEIAAQIAKRGPVAVRYAKEAVARGAEMPLEQALRIETDLTILLQASADRAEGVQAFAEKREPEFKGE
jgi:enoyl-CoA hydratase/carnithine racemase